MNQAVFIGTKIAREEHLEICSTSYLRAMENSSFLEEMKWRGMYFDHTPGVESYLKPGARGYIGFDSDF